MYWLSFIFIVAAAIMGTQLVGLWLTQFQLRVRRFAEAPMDWDIDLDLNTLPVFWGVIT